MKLGRAPTMQAIGPEGKSRFMTTLEVVAEPDEHRRLVAGNRKVRLELAIARAREPEGLGGKLGVESQVEVGLPGLFVSDALERLDAAVVDRGGDARQPREPMARDDRSAVADVVVEDGVAGKKSL